MIQICTKSVPAGMNPFAVLVVTYLMAALASGILFVAFSGAKDLACEDRKRAHTIADMRYARACSRYAAASRCISSGHFARWTNADFMVWQISSPEMTKMNVFNKH
jgi:hypothetical protein